MKKQFGPFRLLAGTHTEDDPVREVKILAKNGDLLDCMDGQTKLVLRMVSGADVLLDGQRLSCYLTEGDRHRRVASPELKIGDAVTLAKEVCYKRGDPPFMSSSPLDQRFNQGRDSIKFELVHENDKGEVEALKRRIAELESKAGKAKQPVS